MDRPTNPTYVSPGIMVGTMVELTRDEQLTVAQLSSEMDRLAFHRGPGWFADWCRAHAKAGRLIRGVIERSHATGEPQRGSRR